MFYDSAALNQTWVNVADLVWILDSRGHIHRNETFCQVGGVVDPITKGEALFWRLWLIV